MIEVDDLLTSFANVSQHSIDIEMTVADGKLGVGIFCPEEMLGLEKAEEALQELKSTLEKLVGKTEESAAP